MHKFTFGSFFSLLAVVWGAHAIASSSSSNYKESPSKVGNPPSVETIKWSDGRHYSGKLKEGIPHGSGTMTWPGVAQYTGTFVNGVRTGKGKMTWSDGESFSGTFINGETNRGVFTRSDGTREEGRFVDNELTGKGIRKFDDGGYWEGNFIKGNISGPAVYTYSDGTREEGRFVDNELTGKGIKKFDDGGYYEGNFIKGKLSGRAVYTYPNGNRTEADFVDGKLVGDMVAISSPDQRLSTQSLASAPEPKLSNTTQTCRTDLSYLNARIPNFQASPLQDQRRAVLSENITRVMQAAVQQGFTPSRAVSAALEQAREFDRVAREALGTAVAVDALGTTDDEFFARLNKGGLDVLNCDNIRNSALCVAIANKLGAIATRATAAEMQCHIRAGTWAASSSSTSASSTAENRQREVDNRAKELKAAQEDAERDFKQCKSNCSNQQLTCTSACMANIRTFDICNMNCVNASISCEPGCEERRDAKIENAERYSGNDRLRRNAASEREIQSAEDERKAALDKINKAYQDQLRMLQQEAARGRAQTESRSRSTGTNGEGCRNRLLADTPGCR